MKFKELFDREMLVEQHVRKQLKIIYEIDLSLIKASEEAKEPAQNIQQETPPEQNSVPKPTQEPQEQPANITQPQDTQQGTPPENSQVSAPSPQELGIASVVTEENNENKIEKKLNGEVVLNDVEKDNTQSFEDIIDILSKKKINGNPLFDEFTSEMLILCCSQNFQQLQSELDKKSKIFVELYYGYNKDDSVGIRFNKRANSEMLTSSMLIDNEIVNAKFSIDRVNQRVAEFRNYEAKKNT